jgi:hypothetical protein
MNITFAHNSILTRATKVFNNFEGCQIPFAAVKLNVRLQDISRRRIDAIVEDNFRSEKDLIFKKDKNYIILMKRTTIKEAERAVIRLKGEIGCKTRTCKRLKDNLHCQASACIFSFIEGSKRMQAKYLNLIPDQNCFDRNTHKTSFGYGEYLKCCELPKTETLKFNQMINVVI